MRSSKPIAATAGVAARMSTQATIDTAPELAIRRELFARGLRYRKHVPVPGRARRSIDIAFPGRKLAVFVDGCFWHSCPLHGTGTKHNGEWWRTKLDENQRRDRDTDSLLVDQGWTVLRFWEHDDPVEVAEAVRIVWCAHG